MWKVANCIDAQATPPAERLEIIPAIFAEFSEIGIRTIEAMLVGTARDDPTASVNQIQALWKAPV